ncbi:MAG: TrkH family potassium uptake protein, partial [Anaerotignaceae bacterium]
MNFSIIRYILGWVLKIEALFMLLPCLVGLIYKERSGISFFLVAVATFLLGYLASRNKPQNQIYFAREGFVIVALSWIVLSIFGALPFVLCGDIPVFTDALFET